jgi:ABC-type polysaccharide/polyol phosphate export permease
MSASATVGTAGRRRASGSRRRIAHRVEVALHLVRTELATRHRGSVLGWVWALGPPLLQLAATYFLFTRVIPLDVPDYPVFLLVGILAWSWFARSLGEGVTSLEQRRELVLRPGFATETLPATSVLVALVDYLIALPVLFVALAVTTGLHPEAAFLPVLLAIQLLYCAGFALAVAPLQVFLRDVRQIVVLLVSVGFWLTPIFYRRAQVPDSLTWLYDVNPMAHLIGAQRQILMTGELPNPGPLAIVGLAGLAVLAAGYAVFAACRHAVPEQL